MPRFPYFGFPHYYNYMPNYPHNLATSASNQSSTYIPHTESKSPTSKIDASHTNKSKSAPIDDDFLFDLFGLKIYFDDILIIGLLFFLYNEGVKDEGLFIVLVLLLLS